MTTKPRYRVPATLAGNHVACETDVIWQGNVSGAIHPGNRTAKGISVEIRIGILNTPRELTIESSQQSSEVEETVAQALAGDIGYLRLLDSKGAVYIIPTATIVYVELGSEETRRAGFFA